MKRMSLQGRIRQMLDAPLSRKPLFFWLISPLLFLLSFAVAVCAFAKRCSYEKRRAFSLKRGEAVAGRTDLEIICIGNVLVGGTGKSPVVHAFLKEGLSNGRDVVLASRGHGAPPGTAFCAPAVQVPSAWLADEVAEAVLLIKEQCTQEEFSRLWVAQGARRAKTLSVLPERKSEQDRWLVVADDGLQHFGFYPQLRVCVWSEKLFQKAPRASFPVGPFREGFFGILERQKGRAFELQFDFSFWSRVPANAPDQKEALRERLLRDFSSDRDRFGLLMAENFWLLPKHPSAEEKQNLLLALKQKTLAVACGLAQPEDFLKSVTASLEKITQVPDLRIPPDSLFFAADHSFFPEAWEKEWSRFSHIVVSGKDWARLSQVEAWKEKAHRGQLWVLCVRVQGEDLFQNSIGLCGLLARQESL
jgi:tetraacyldisaccharide 4'-kinase